MLVALLLSTAAFACPDLSGTNEKQRTLVRVSRTSEGSLRLDISSGENSLGPAICRRR